MSAKGAFSGYLYNMGITVPESDIIVDLRITNGKMINYSDIGNKSFNSNYKSASYYVKEGNREYFECDKPGRYCAVPFFQSTANSSLSFTNFTTACIYRFKSNPALSKHGDYSGNGFQLYFNNPTGSSSNFAIYQLGLTFYLYETSDNIANNNYNQPYFSERIVKSTNDQSFVSEIAPVYQPITWPNSYTSTLDIWHIVGVTYDRANKTIKWFLDGNLIYTYNDAPQLSNLRQMNFYRELDGKSDLYNMIFVKDNLLWTTNHTADTSNYILNRDFPKRTSNKKVCYPSPSNNGDYFDKAYLY